MAPLFDGREDTGARAARARVPVLPSLAGRCFRTVSPAGVPDQFGLTVSRPACEAGPGAVARQPLREASTVS